MWEGMTSRGVEKRERRNNRVNPDRDLSGLSGVQQVPYSIHDELSAVSLFLKIRARSHNGSAST